MQSKRVLIVDDEPAVTIFLAETLEKLGNGYIVETANSGGEALAKIRQIAYVLVLTDYKMPGMNGLELARAVRHFSPYTRVVLMTAYGTDELRDPAKHLELDGYIDKPFTMDQIREAVTRAIARASEDFQQPDAHSVQPVVHEPAKPASVDTSAQLVPPSVHEPVEALLANSVQPSVHEPVKASLADTAVHSVHKLLEALVADTAARCVLLVNSGGYPLDAVGQTYGLHIPSLGALIAANFAAATELARLLGNRSIFKANHHEGPDCNIYSCEVNRDLLLAVIFGPESKSGAIWFFTKRTAAALASLVPDQSAGVKFEGDLATAIDAELDHLFDQGDNDLGRQRTTLQEAAATRRLSAAAS